jgi:hypothetical protein
MRVMVLVKANADSEAGSPPPEGAFEEMGKFNEQLVKAGVMLAGEGLAPSSQGKRVRFDGKQPTVVDGPFAETKELVAGFWLWEVASIDEAVEWLKRSPFQDTEVEIRRVAELEDFGDAATAQVREQDQRLREQVASRQQ